MKTIKITLNETGSTACIVKTFSVYQNSYKEQEFEVRVPKSFFIESNGNEFVTTVKMGAILYGESGKTVETKSYFMDKIGEDTRFYIYKALLPKSFVLYKGVQDLVFNVVNIDTNENTVLSIVTTQKAPLEVVASAYIEDEEIEPSDTEILYGLVAEKQNKDTTGDEQEISITGISETKEVVEAINKTGEKVLQNVGEIGANTEDISQNASKIADLEAIVGTGQEYIGTMRGSSLPTQIALNDFVSTQKSRQAKGGDMVIFVLEIAGATDKTFKYNFNGTEWQGYEIPPVELAGNGSAGLVSGTYGVGSENTTLVDIVGGDIKNIYVKDNGGEYRNVREYLNTDKARVDNILSGSSSVGKALRAVSDELGNNIVDTYLTINAGATKRYVRDYALPRTFNDKYFLTAEGYVLEMPEAVVPQFSVISDQIGETELFEVGLEVGAEYELSRKNSSSNSICILANSNLTARLRLSTFIDDTPLSVELSNAVEFKTGEMVRVEFGSDFTLLGDNVLNVIDGDKIKQVLEVVRETSAEVTFEVWSNETYPSIFGLNTQTQRIVVAQGELGEQEVIEAEGTVAENSVVFSLNNFDLNTNTEIFFDLKVATVEEIGEAVEVKFELDGETVRIATPYNFESGQATVGMLKQVFTAFGGGFQKWAFKGFVREIGSDLVCFADLDSLEDLESKIDEIIEDFAGLEAEVAGKEDTFAKNTAFNKDFGTDAENIAMNGQASVGVSENVSREDHAHPSDTTKADDSVVVKITAQELTEAEKSQARSNIGAGASGFSGDYDDLSNKPITRADLSVTVASGELLHQHSGASSGGLISGSLYKAKDGAWELVSVGKDYIDNALLLKANDNAVVKTSGNQTVGGQKTFSNNATFKGDVLIEGDITQSGESYETHAEQVYTTKDEIILREGATAGLGSGEAGFTFKKAASDGITDIVMKVKNDGILRVGKVGGIQPLATREETPTDNGFARWNATAKRFDSVAIKQTTGQSTTDIMSQKAITDNLSISVWDGTYPAVGSTFASIGGTGTGAWNNPYIIDTAQKLAWLSSNYAQSSATGKHYKQTKDIDLAGKSWTPINQNSASETYYYDGGGCFISNLYINSTLNYTGLFGCISSGYIKNVNIANGSVISTANYTGGIVGYSSSTFNFCSNNATITGSQYTGGIAGYSSSNYTFNSCSNNGRITGTDYTGGIAGRVYSSPITNCSNNATITGSQYTGGIAGNFEGSSTATSCSSFASVTATGTNSKVALIANGGTVTDCIAEGTLTGTNKDYRGQKADKGDIPTNYVTTDTTQTVSGDKTFNAPTNIAGTEQATTKFMTANGGSLTIGKEGPNSGTMLKFCQVDGTPRLLFRSSGTPGAMVWSQPEEGAQLYIDLGLAGSDYHRITMPTSAGTLALTSQLPSLTNYVTKDDAQTLSNKTLASPNITTALNLNGNALGSAGGLESIVAKSLGTNGYIKYASGLIIMWGKQALTTGANKERTYSFPLSFTNNCLSMVATMSYSADLGGGFNNTINIRSFTKSNYVFSQNWSEASRSIYYIAIGY